MSSLVSQTQQTVLDMETTRIFIKMGIFSRYHPFFNKLFEILKKIKDASEVIQFISQLTISIQEKIRELFIQIGIKISEEQYHILMKTPIESFESLMCWYDYFRNTLNENQRGKYREKHQNRFIHLDELISFSKNFYSNKQFGIFVKNLTGRSIDFQITHQMRVEELKMKIQEKYGIPVEQQRFIFSGREFKDSMLFGMYNITKDSTIHLVLRLRGGMHHITSTGNFRKDFDSIKEELSPEIQDLLEEIL
jgi:hypothetical protein